MAIFYLAEALQHEGNYSEAISNYRDFLALRPGHYESEIGIRGCQLAPQWKREGSRYIVKSAKLFNSRRADFAPMLFGEDFDQLYFTSSTEKATGDNKSEITGTKKSDIFFSKIDDKGKWTRPVAVEGELNTEWDEGITSFTPDGTTM